MQKLEGYAKLKIILYLREKKIREWRRKNKQNKT